MHSIDIWRIREGRLYEHWDELNSLEFFQQIGAIPSRQLTRPNQSPTSGLHMLTTSLALASLGALACAVVYGTDVFAAIVLRPALAALDNEALVQAAGRIHQYADQRMPLPGAAGTLAAAAATLTASLAGHPLQAGLSGGALVALLAWLMLYLRVAAPINRELTRAAAAHEIPANARALQKRWDSVIGLRVVLQTIALALLVSVLAFT